MELRKINLRDAAAQWEYTSCLPADENGLTNPYHGVSWEEYRDQVLPALMSHEHPVNMPDWFVPESYYYLWDGDHIGYSIRRDARGRGYGTEGLRLTLEIARAIIPEDEIYLRVYKTNLASQKVMLKNGAFLAGQDEEHYFMRIPKEKRAAER